MDKQGKRKMLFINCSFTGCSGWSLLHDGSKTGIFAVCDLIPLWVSGRTSQEKFSAMAFSLCCSNIQILSTSIWLFHSLQMNPSHSVIYELYGKWLLILYIMHKTQETSSWYCKYIPFPFLLVLVDLCRVLQSGAIKCLCGLQYHLKNKAITYSSWDIHCCVSGFSHQQ